MIHNVASPVAQGVVMVTELRLPSPASLGGVLYFSLGNCTSDIYIPHFPLKNSFFVYTLFYVHIIFCIKNPLCIVKQSFNDEWKATETG